MYIINELFKFQMKKYKILLGWLYFDYTDPYTKVGTKVYDLLPTIVPFSWHFLENFKYKDDPNVHGIQVWASNVWRLLFP